MVQNYYFHILNMQDGILPLDNISYFFHLIHYRKKVLHHQLDFFPNTYCQYLMIAKMSLNIDYIFAKSNLMY